MTLGLLAMLAFLLVFAPFVLLFRVWPWVIETVKRLPSPTSVLARMGLALVALAAALEVDGP
jgi:small neutral amino acid transporter SnatA (MarC family)